MKGLSFFFAIVTLFGGLGAGNMTQSNSIALVLFSDFGFPKWLSGIILATGLWLVIVGGIKRIGRVAEMLVPSMALTYIISCLIILSNNLSEIPASFALIIDSAFAGQPPLGVLPEQQLPEPWHMVFAEEQYQVRQALERLLLHMVLPKLRTLIRKVS